MTEHTFIIPGEPISVNHAYRTFTDGRVTRRALTNQGRTFKAAVTLITRRERIPQPTTRFRLTLHFFGHWDTLEGKPRKKDLSNLVKLLEDGICAGLGVDDCWVRGLTLDATHTTAPAHTVVTITPIEETPHDILTARSRRYAGRNP